MNAVSNIGLIGSGNVATHLGFALASAGFTIKWVSSRTPAHARRLAKKLESRYILNPADHMAGVDLVIISVSDDAVIDVVDKLGCCDIPLVHTSASLPLDVLLKATRSAGVFYPLQTFSIEREMTMKCVPLLIEASNPSLLHVLERTGKKLGARVLPSSQRERLCLHVAAVFACNFTNYLYSASEEILRSCGFSFDILHPLIRETTAKAIDFLPARMQTGPAARGDVMIIRKHLEYLKVYPELKKAYSVLSENILNKNKTPQ